MANMLEGVQSVTDSNGQEIGVQLDLESEAGQGKTAMLLRAGDPDRIFPGRTYRRLMRLYFLRHGEADWPGWDRPDDERPLTSKGHKEVERVADFIAERELKPVHILSSPLPRALETGQIVARRLNL